MALDHGITAGYRSVVIHSMRTLATAPGIVRAPFFFPHRWTDEQGVTTWTDSLEKVPRRYREQTSRLTP